MKVTEEMVNRFLMWRLPEDFRPDGGISFTRSKYGETVHPMPVGTNLLTYTQAKAMLEFVLAAADPDSEAQHAVGTALYALKANHPRNRRIAEAIEALEKCRG